MQIDIVPFTLIGATTRSGLLSNPLRDRFMAHLHFEKEAYSEAAAYWQELLELDPDNMRAMTAYGNCYRRMKEFGSALEVFDRARKIEPGNFYALFSLLEVWDYHRAARVLPLGSRHV